MRRAFSSAAHALYGGGFRSPQGLLFCPKLPQTMLALTADSNHRQHVIRPDAALAARCQAGSHCSVQICVRTGTDFSCRSGRLSGPRNLVPVPVYQETTGQNAGMRLGINVQHTFGQ